MPRGECERPTSSPEQEDRLQAALQTLEAGIDSILSSEGLAVYLQILARFYTYSPSKVAFIHGITRGAAQFETKQKSHSYSQGEPREQGSP